MNCVVSTGLVFDQKCIVYVGLVCRTGIGGGGGGGGGVGVGGAGSNVP